MTPQERLDSLRIDCKGCGQVHDGVFDIGAQYPDSLLAIPEDQRAGRVKVGSDLCVIDDEHYLVRGVLEVPIIGTDDVFGWGVWGSLKKENFETYVEHYDDRDEPAYGPFFSWLDTRMIGYEWGEDSLAAEYRFRPDGQRPLMFLQPTDHLLSQEQQHGITVDRLFEIYAAYGHS